MWTNEENGGRGNKGYRGMHMDELDKGCISYESDAGVFALKDLDSQEVRKPKRSPRKYMS
ncbi:hypothetical protein Ct9H90mP29_15800 [bacterium]|nr:MAG: hypothetical protein Ct9H90mP29_15800 [bacterium]